MSKNTDIRDIQNNVLEIYKEIKKVCDKHNIRYYAIGGTAIGAVRHNGFIPWDDDIDLAFPYPDYLKFVEYAKDELPNWLAVRPEGSYDSRQTFTKIENVNTTYVSSDLINQPNSYIGVNVDIMPLIGSPNDEKQRMKFFKKVKRYVILNRLMQYTRDTRKDFRGFVVWICSIFFNLFLPNDLWYKKWENAIAQYDYDSSDYIFEAWATSIIKPFDRKWFEGVIVFPFEDTTMQCSSGYDNYLRTIFGDYMQLPPVEKRVRHASGLVDLENSFQIYKEKKQNGL